MDEFYKQYWIKEVQTQTSTYYMILLTQNSKIYDVKEKWSSLRER